MLNSTTAPIAENFSQFDCDRNILPSSSGSGLGDIIGIAVKNQGAAGFITQGGGRDIFVHASTPEQARIMHLNKGRRVIVGVVAGRKGPEAASLQGVY